MVYPDLSVSFYKDLLKHSASVNIEDAIFRNEKAFCIANLKNHLPFWEHEVFILAGKGVVRDQNGTETPIGEGTTVFIPGGENHCLINQGGDVLRFICLIPTGVE